jgi:hypothetical protein
MDRSQLAAADFALRGANSMPSDESTRGDGDGPDGERVALAIQRLRDQGHLNDDQEAIAIRFFNDFEHTRREEASRVLAEYSVREKRDGTKQARAWLEQVGRAMGTRDRKAIAELLSRLGLAPGDATVPGGA